MAIKNTLVGYGSVTKTFHWLIFFLLLFMVILGYSLDEIPKDVRSVYSNIHKLTGVLILVLTLMRAAWALANPKPLLPLDTPEWQKTAERTVHLLLYLVVIAMPIVGLIGSSAAGKLPHMGGVSIGFAIKQNKALVSASFATHELLAIILIILVSIHVGAALYHCFIKHDDTLSRMLPGRSK